MHTHKAACSITIVAILAFVLCVKTVVDNEDAGIHTSDVRALDTV